MRESRTVLKLVDVTRSRSDVVPLEITVASDGKGDIAINDVSNDMLVEQSKRQQHAEHMQKYRST